MSRDLLAALVAGVACGAIPLVYGLARARVGLALGGFAACAGAGLVLGVLGALPVAALFVYLVWRSSGEAAAPTQ